MSEKALWKEMKKNIGHRGHFTRVESHATANGFPDVNFCIRKEGTIELKFSGDETAPPEIRPSQVKWHQARLKYDGNCWVFAKLKINGKWWYFLVHGENIIRLAKAESNADWFDTNGFRWEGTPNWNHVLTAIS